MMLISPFWRALVDAGVEMTALDAQRVELRRAGRSVRLPLKVFRRALKPSEVEVLVTRYDEPGLLLLPTATADVRHAIEGARWSLLIGGPGGVHGSLRFGDADVLVGGQKSDGPSSRQSRRGRPGRVPWGVLTAVRCLVEQPALTQKALATLVHMSQPRISQVLKSLAGQGLVERVDGGWVPRDFDGLLRLWLDLYPGPGGISTYWFGLDAPRDQAAKVIRRLPRAGGPEPFAVVSGDVAADIIAPWGTPGRAVMYARAGSDLTDAGLTPVGEAEATLELIVPHDSGVWPQLPYGSAGGRQDSSLPIADPLQILWDVNRCTGADGDGAVARLWDALRERSRAIHATGTS